jgi:hypothetical protein
MIAASPPPPSRDVRELLSDAELATLRAAFDGDAMLALARAASVEVFPPAAPFAEFLVEYFYGYRGGAGAPSTSPEPWSARDRELVVLSLVASHFSGRGLNVGLHVYWGLMSGLSVQRVCDALTLSGIYSGMQSFTLSFSVLRTTLGLMRTAAAPGGNPASTAIVAALFDALR